jgi:GT2 family glycosyltransferase
MFRSAGAVFPPCAVFTATVHPRRLDASFSMSNESPLEPRVAVVVINTRAVGMTIECLEALLRIDSPRLRVVLCDNNEDQGPVDRVLAWARGEEAFDPESVRAEHRRLVSPPAPKPVNYVVLEREEAESGRVGCEAKLVVVRNRANLGFSGGNNVGLRHVLACGQEDYVWLLNNDAVSEPQAPGEMVRALQADPRAGMCGSCVMIYDKPDTVECLCGYTFKMSNARVSPFGHGGPRPGPNDPSPDPACMDYMYGASLMLTRELFERVGLLDEDYFLYFEEMDLAMRAKGLFTKACAPGAVVFHRRGGSVDSQDADAERRRLFSKYHWSRSRLTFMRKHNRRALPGIYWRVVKNMTVAALKGEKTYARMLWQVLWGRPFESD